MKWDENTRLSCGLRLLAVRRLEARTQFVRYVCCVKSFEQNNVLYAVFVLHAIVL